MHLNLARQAQDSGTCSSGTGIYYVCSSNGFQGCCTVNPCALSSCPDKASSSSISVVTTLVVSVQPASLSPNVAASTVTVFTDHSSAISTSASVISSSSSIQTSTSSRDIAEPVAAVPATATSAPASSTQPPSANATPNNTGIIVGVVCGMVGISILSILLWFCFRCHRTSKERRNTRKSYDLSPPSKDFVLDQVNNVEIESPNKSQTDIFSAFGGRYRSPQIEYAELAPHTEIQDPTTEDSEDRTLPDIEKARVKTPPVHEHPAYAALNPLPYQPSMTSHPAYHVSHLNKHPAFRSANASYVPKSQSQRSVRATYHITSPRPGQIDEIVSPIIPSPVAGHLELEAEVPNSYISPTTSNTFFRYPIIPQDTRRSKTKRRASKEASTSTIPIGMQHTSPSRTSIPMDLGAEAPSSSVPNLPLPSTFAPASEPVRNSNRVHSRRNSPQFIPSGGEIISQIQRPTPRSSLNSLQNQPITSHLETSHPNIFTYSHVEEKEMDTSATKTSLDLSQRWSDATIVTAAPASSNILSDNSHFLSVPDLITAARLVASPDPTATEGHTPTSIYTDGTASWGSWTAG